jgi:hypothetical protein
VILPLREAGKPGEWTPNNRGEASDLDSANQASYGSPVASLLRNGSAPGLAANRRNVTAIGTLNARMDALASTTLPAKRHWLWPTRRRFVVGFLIALVIWGWLDVRNRGRVIPNDPWAHKTDFTVYTEAGAAFFDGRDPYTVANARGWTYLYPPLFAILVSPLHSLAPENQVIIWFAISLVTCWGCYRELVRIGRLVLPAGAPGRTFGSIPTWLGSIAVATATIPTLNCLQRGQVGVVKLYLLLLGFRLLVQQRSVVKPLWGGCLLALAITLKITPVIPACVAVTQQVVSAWTARKSAPTGRGWTGAAGLAAGMALWLLLVPALAIGWQANIGHVENWWKTVAVRAESTSEDDFAGNSTTVRNQSLANAAYRFGNWSHYYFAGGPHDEGPAQRRKGGPGLLMDSPQIDKAILAVRCLAGCLLLAVSFRMARAHDVLGQTASFGLACVATLIIFTIARGHYYMLLLPANIFVPLWLQRANRPRSAIVVAVVPLLLVLAHYTMLDLAGRVGVLGLGTTAWYFGSCGLLLVSSRSAAENAIARKDPSSAAQVVEHPLAA